MPFIHVKSLPFEKPLAMGAVLEGITEDFAKATNIDPEHVTVTWEFLSPDHYAVAGKAAERQPQVSHPLLVDLLAPDFNSPAAFEKMLGAVAASIAKHAKIPIGNIFVNCRAAHSGMVLDAGAIVRW